jgi:hypothetical protein
MHLDDMDSYLTSSDPFWQNALSMSGGLALGVIATRSIDNLAGGRLHPLVLFGAKVAVGLGAASLINGRGYERLAYSFALGALADSSITYADQIQYRYLPGAPETGAPATPRLP